MAPEVISEHRCFGGIQGFYRHVSETCDAPMRFGVFQPPHLASRGGRLPVVYFLAGLECNETTFALKAGAQRMAAELGLVLVTPDTSPRDTGTPGEDEHWDFGTGAGFYLDATRPPWSAHYRMESYVVRELPALLARHFPIDAARAGIVGHSMGGHGALTLALRNPGTYRFVSAFAPIASASRVPWGEKAFSRYLGPDRETWRQYDACDLVRIQRLPSTIRIDQGLGDRFLDSQLKPELFEAACAAAGQALDLRWHELYDHGYHFIATFVEGHLRHHAAALLHT